MENREAKLIMLKNLAETVEIQSVEQVVGAIILSIIYLGCNCAGFTGEEMSHLERAIENRLTSLISAANSIQR